MAQLTHTTTWCTHCDLTPSRRRNQLCDPCNTYKHKYGQLPPHKVIHRRTQRITESTLAHRISSV